MPQPAADIPTSERLAIALAQIDGLPAYIIARARKGHYDDYRSELPFPLHALTHDLERTRIPAAVKFCDRVLGGEFDGTRAEAEAWAQTPEGRHAIQKLMTAEGQRSLGELLAKFPPSGTI